MKASCKGRKAGNAGQLTLALALVKARSTEVLLSLPPRRPVSRHSLAKLAPSIPACIAPYDVWSLHTLVRMQAH